MDENNKKSTFKAETKELFGKKIEIEVEGQALTERDFGEVGNVRAKVQRQQDEEGRQVEVIWILDVSGSKRGDEELVIRMFNDCLEECEDKRLFFTTFLFNTRIDCVNRRECTLDIMDLDYKPEISSTYMYRSVAEVIDWYNRQPKKAIDSDILYVLVTDGEDTLNFEHEGKEARRLVKEELAQGRNFIVLGNYDYKRAAYELGVPEENVIYLGMWSYATDFSADVVKEIIKSMLGRQKDIKKLIEGASIKRHQELKQKQKAIEGGINK